MIRNNPVSSNDTHCVLPILSSHLFHKHLLDSHQVLSIKCILLLVSTYGCLTSPLPTPPINSLYFPQSSSTLLSVVGHDLSCHNARISSHLSLLTFPLSFLHNSSQFGRYSECTLIPFPQRWFKSKSSALNVFVHLWHFSCIAMNEVALWFVPSFELTATSARSPYTNLLFSLHVGK